jgi:hypothetical protein
MVKEEYRLGISSNGGYEEVGRTTSREEAEAWISSPSETPETMHVYGKVFMEEEKPPAIDVGNKFFVSMNQSGITILDPPRDAMTYDEALVLAAWLVAMAEPFAVQKFEDVLTAVQNT